MDHSCVYVVLNTSIAFPPFHAVVGVFDSEDKARSAVETSKKITRGFCAYSIYELRMNCNTEAQAIQQKDMSLLACVIFNKISAFDVISSNLASILINDKGLRDILLKHDAYLISDSVLRKEKNKRRKFPSVFSVDTDGYIFANNMFIAKVEWKNPASDISKNYAAFREIEDYLLSITFPKLPAEDDDDSMQS